MVPDLLSSNGANQTRCRDALSLPGDGELDDDIYHSVVPGLVIVLSGYNSFSFE